MIHSLRQVLTLSLILALYATGGWAQETEPRKTQNFKTKAALGVAITPRNFPSHSALDVDDAFQTAAEIADHAVFIYQWHELDMQRLPEFLHFASLYKEAYDAIKQISPETRVFVSFQCEWMRIIDAKEPRKIPEHRKVIDVFRPQLDVVARTTYPSPFHDSPEELPHDYYRWFDCQQRPDKTGLY